MKEKESRKKKKRYATIENSAHMVIQRIEMLRAILSVKTTLRQ